MEVLMEMLIVTCDCIFYVFFKNIFGATTCAYWEIQWYPVWRISISFSSKVRIEVRIFPQSSIFHGLVVKCMQYPLWQGKKKPTSILPVRDRYYLMIYPLLHKTALIWTKVNWTVVIDWVTTGFSSYLFQLNFMILFGRSQCVLCIMV